jgi:Tfp pilus assembly protein PilF
MYVAKSVFPVNLAVFYPLSLKGLPIAQVAAALIFLAAVTVAALLFARRCPYVTTGWLWFLGMLTPVIGIIQFGDQALADRYMYLPMIGLLLIVAWGGAAVLARWPRASAALGVAAVGACIPLTFIQTTYWRNTMTLWEHAARTTSYNRLAHYNLGCGYLDQKDYPRAAEHFYAALQVDPNDFESITNLGVALSAMNKNDEAIRLYYTALTIKPDHVNAQINLAVALTAKGQYDEAVRWLTDALYIEPGNADAHYNLGFTRYQQKRYAEAERSLIEALRLRPDYVEAGYCLGLVLMHQGRAKEAADAFSNVLALQPQHVGARRELELLRHSQ